jgi:AcrR family transcriptional regulator
VRPRRAAGRPRGAPVVDAVLGAAVDELARVGYAALSVDQVAVRARVSKSTVYRRWRTKAELVEAALASTEEDAPAPSGSDDIRSDLLAVARRTRDRMSTSPGRGLFRVLLGGSCAPELSALASTLGERFAAPSRRVIERARRRGELRAGVDPDLLLETMHGWIAQRLLRRRAPVTPGRLALLVDLLLHGALPGKPRRGEGRPPRLRPSRAGAGGGEA